MKPRKLVWGLGIAVALIFMASSAMAYTVFVEISDQLRLEEIDGIQFDLVGASPNEFADLTKIPVHVSESRNVDSIPTNGSVPEFMGLKNILWALEATQTGFIFYDKYVAGEAPLAAGLVFEFTLGKAFGLENFLLTSSWYPDGKYPPPWSVSERAVAEGTAYAIVPIPSALLLLGSGLFGLVALRRKRS